MVRLRIGRQKRFAVDVVLVLRAVRSCRTSRLAPVTSITQLTATHVTPASRLSAPFSPSHVYLAGASLYCSPPCARQASVAPTAKRAPPPLGPSAPPLPAVVQLC